MKKEKFEILLKLLDRWDININQGTIKTKKGEKHYKNEHGYFVVGTTYNGKNIVFSVHQIICAKAGYNLVDKVIDHIDMDKTNNCISNLEVITHQENATRCAINGVTRKTRAKAENHGNTKMTNTDVEYIKKCLNENSKGVCELAKMFGISHSRISEIKSNKTWRSVGIK